MRLRIVATYAFVCLLILGAGQVAADDCGPGEFVTKCCCEERSESCVTQWCAGPESEKKVPFVMPSLEPIAWNFRSLVVGASSYPSTKLESQTSLRLERERVPPQLSANQTLFHRPPPFSD